MPAHLKPAHLRRRRNRATTTAVLLADVKPAEWPPALPKRPGGGEWSEAARAWWSSVWGSPAAGEFFQSDVLGLVRGAWLVDLFSRNQSPAVSAELRMLEKEFGLTPQSRHVLALAAVRVATANGE